MNTNNTVPSLDLRNFQPKSQFLLIGGPCSIESKEQMQEVAPILTQSGVSFMRGGVWKLRTNPDSFQGLGVEALTIFNKIQTQYPLQLISEITDPRQIDILLPHIAAFQVGARNMYNYDLLKELAKTDKPVILKRAFSATVDEWLKAAEYLKKGHQGELFLCERGIRTFETSSRYTFDINSALIAKQRTQLPVLIDPSHGVGLREYVPSLVWAAAAAGLDGAIVETHPNPECALSDGRQSLDLQQFQSLLPKLDAILKLDERSRL